MIANTIGELGGALLANGYEPLPISPGEKVPYIRNWSTLTIDTELVRSWCDRMKASDYVGLRCGHVIALDIDIDDAEVTALLTEDAAFSLGEAPRRYGKPGRALLLYRASTLWPKKTLKLIGPDDREHAIEALAHGQQFVAFGVHPDTGQPYRWEGGDPLAVPVGDLPEVTESELNDWLDGALALLPDGWRVGGGAGAWDDDERFLLSFQRTRSEADMTLDELIEHRARMQLADWVPDALPDAREYQDGYRISSAALGRDLEEDLQLLPTGIYDFGEECGKTAVRVVAEYHTGGDASEARDKLTRWLGIDVERHAVVAAQHEDRENRRAMWERRIGEAQGAAKLERLTGPISRDGALSAIERETLVKTWQDRYLAVAGVRVSLPVVRQSMQARRAASADDVEIPEWCEGWYYITHNDAFYHYQTGNRVTAQGFNALFQRHMPADDDGRRQTAVRAALDDYEIPAVQLAVYAPHLGERFTLENAECVNSFIPASVPHAADTITEAGQRAVDRVQQHILHLCSGREWLAGHLLSLMAYSVQNPGRKVRHAPLIKGIPGDGKSLLLDVLAAALGARNVRSVLPTVVNSQFNGYAEGSCVVGLEEVRMAGHNRYDVINALKPLITNNAVDIHKKGQDSYNAINVTNYIAFTNHNDALPIEVGDRRWLVIFTPWPSLAAMERVVGEPIDSYFQALTADIENHGPAIRRFLLDYPTAGFNPNAPAPNTPEKDSMREGDKEDIEVIIGDLIQRGAPGVTAQALSTTHLTAALENEEFSGAQGLLVPHGRALAKILQRLGWTRYPKQVKWQGSRCRVWVQGLPLDDNDAVRVALDDVAPF